MEQDDLKSYLEEDPKSLSQERLQIAAKAFGVPLEEVKNIAKGMSNSRKEIQEEYGSSA